MNVLTLAQQLADIAYAYLPTEHTNPGTSVEVEMFGVKKVAIIMAEPLFDPTGERVKS